MKSEVPCRIPWIFPLIRHADQVGVEHMIPLKVTRQRTFRRYNAGEWHAVAFEPAADIVIIELLCPQHSGESLTHDIGSVSIDVFRYDGRIKNVCFRLARQERFVEVLSEQPSPSLHGGTISETKASSRRISGSDLELIMRRRLCATFGPIHCGHVPVQYKPMERILNPGCLVRLSPKFFRVRVVIGKQNLRRTVGDEPTFTK